jgi:hypothetical protein
MDQVSKYLVAVIKDVDAEISVEGCGENFLRFFCCPLVLK